MNEIGEKLKEARKDKGYTLDDLQQITKIQKRYLIAVEEGNLDVLPGNFYARAFIKQYADSVGLNGEQLIKEHVDALPQSSQSTYAKSASSTQTRSRGKKSGFLATLQDSLPTILIVLLVIAIIVAIYLAMSSGNGNDSSFIQEDESSNIVEVDDNSDGDESDSAEEDPEDGGETPADDEAQDDENQEEEESEAQTIEETDGSTNTTTYTVKGEHPESQQLNLSADGGESWVSVEIDGEMANQALLANGQSLVTEFDNNVSSIAIVIGNASSTSIILNDEPLPYGEAATEAVRQEMYIEFE